MSGAYREYKDLIQRLDEEGKGLSKKAVDFIASLLDDPPAYLTDKQVDWLRILEETCLYE